MPVFPALDPIPLPAPVALLKFLHLLTMALHFIAVQMLLGGLASAVVLNVLGRRPEANLAAAALAKRLPIVMTYVINLGVPPLLFAQVLYGRALYTSSVLIGAWWIAVIPLLMLCYWLLYRFSGRLEEGRTAWWAGLAAFALAGGIAQIYTSNMTLMLRPEVWPAMFSASQLGTAMPTGDPTLPARLSFMIGGSFTVAGFWMLWLSGRAEFNFTARRFLMNLGGRMAAVAALAQVGLAWRVLAAQPDSVAGGLWQNPWYTGAGYAWAAAMALIVAVGIWTAFSRTAPKVASWAAPAVILVQVGAMTLFRDGIRDVTLLGKGFDVWNRTVVTNWSVVILFLALLVAGLGVMGWLVSVVARARPAVAKAA